MHPIHPARPPNGQDNCIIFNNIGAYLSHCVFILNRPITIHNTDFYTCLADRLRHTTQRVLHHFCAMHENNHDMAGNQ